MEIYLAGREELDRVLMRRKKRSRTMGVDLGHVLKEILSWANRFVPSKSGSIFLDDPILKREGREGLLYFAACFGENSEGLAGSTIPATRGIVGETYTSGAPYISEDVAVDQKFERGFDEKTKYHTQSIICSPIMLNGSVIGVLEMINRLERTNYNRNDLALLEIFAGYTAVLIGNSLAATDFEELSKRDNLTGLFNDRYFHRRLEEEVRRALIGGHDVSLIFFDLDRFKEVNDERGHIAGSNVLRELGILVAEVQPDEHCAAARYGGDEYAMILPGMTAQEAQELAEHLRRRIELHVFLADEGPRGEPAHCIEGVITASIGVASLRDHVSLTGDSYVMAESLLRSADQAMYLAKEEGKNRVCVSRLPVAE